MSGYAAFSLGAKNSRERLTPMSDLPTTFDIASDDFSTSSAVRSLHEYQCALVRNAFPEGGFPEIARKTVDLFAEYAHLRSQDEVTPGVPYAVVQRMANMTMIEDDLHDLQYPLIRAIRESAVWDVVTGYLGTDAVCCLLPICSLRAADPETPQHAIPYHQDGFGLPDGKEYDMLSVWLLLSPEVCGPEAPNVEFMAGPASRNLALEENPVSEVYRHAQAADREISALEKEGFFRWSPEVRVSDALVFTRHNPHRTLIQKHHTRARYSVETRFLPINEATKDLFARRKNPLIEIYRGRTLAPREINWIGGEWQMRELDWQGRRRPFRESMLRLFAR